MMKKKYLIIGILTGAALLAACSLRSNKGNKPAPKNRKIKTVNQTKPDKVTRILKNMTLNEKIGQLYFAHSTGNTSQMLRDVKKYQLSGTTLFAKDFQNKSKQKFRDEMKQYQNNSKHGLFIATDQEGGKVSRLSANPQLTNNRVFPSPQEIYKKDGLAGIAKEDAQVAKILYKNGINMNFAPVADVAKNKSSFIYNRTLGTGYIETVHYISVAVKAIQKEKIASTLKHFPGYGDAGDTHTGFAEINKPLNDYKNEDLLPFKAGIEADADGIMVSHIIIKKLDPELPASLSPAAHKLLRNKLSYKGLIISDDLQMGAITQYAKLHHTNADVLALKAGNDLLLGGDYKTGIPAIKQVVKNRQISERQINQSVKRILQEKEKLGILK